MVGKLGHGPHPNVSVLLAAARPAPGIRVRHARLLHLVFGSVAAVRAPLVARVGESGWVVG
jgi:hypothetical protein